jgi:hypothetical protein
LQSLTGFSVEEFDSFLPAFRYERDEYCSHYTLQGKVGECISYGRGNGLLPMIGDKLPFILSCLKSSPLQKYHGATFGMTQPQCNARIRLPSEILLKTLKTPEELPDRNSQRMQSVLRGINDVLPDGTERPVRRPQDSDRQKSCYSGKKTHNVKNNPLCRCHKYGFDDTVMLIACGLHNYRISFKESLINTYCT